MTFLSRSQRVLALAVPADMRKGFDGLAAMVRCHLGCEPTSGDLFLFVSRDRLRAKVLLWDGTGLCIYAKRLERGRFAPLWQRLRDGRIELSGNELALFLEGCDEVARRPLSPPAVDFRKPMFRAG